MSAADLNFKIMGALQKERKDTWEMSFLDLPKPDRRKTPNGEN
jgi:hypothetical protein